MPKAKAVELTVHVLLDRSGSMQTIKADAIGGFNSYVEDLAKTSPKSTLSLTIFDNESIDTIVDNVVVTEVEPLTDKTYVPRGATPLLDAIAKAVAKLDKTKGKRKVLVISTDGQENASTEHKRATIKALLDERQKQGWLVLYLGANQDAFAEGGFMGTQVANTMNYAATSVGTRNSFAAASGATRRYASTGQMSAAAFTTEERDAAEEKE
jgi:hypothetical protein